MVHQLLKDGEMMHDELLNEAKRKQNAPMQYTIYTKASINTQNLHK